MKILIFLSLLLFSLGCEGVRTTSLQEKQIVRLPIANPEGICFSENDTSFYLVTDDGEIARLNVNFELIHIQEITNVKFVDIFVDDFFIYTLSPKEIIVLKKASFEIVSKRALDFLKRKNRNALSLFFNAWTRTFNIIVEEKGIYIYELEPKQFKFISKQKLKGIDKATAAMLLANNILLIDNQTNTVYKIDITDRYKIISKYQIQQQDIVGITYSEKIGLILLSKELRRAYVYEF
ncbi:MAG: hypothetical protein N2517_07260 [Ignavibacteria bacterium]|nr:hypothetical protein [Ignavibacteria bacterium]